MLIVLKGADFSANKIGVISIPRTSLNVTTTAILAAYTKVMTVDKQNAFDDFIIGLKNSGIWNKIAFAYFPFLANSVTEALYEAKIGTPKSATLNAASLQTAYILDSYGLKTSAWVSADGLSQTPLQYTYGVNTNSFFIALLSKGNSTSLFGASLDVASYMGLNGSILLGTVASGIRKTTQVTISPSYNTVIGNSRTPANLNSSIDLMVNGVLTTTEENLGTTYVNPVLNIKKIGIATGGNYGQYFYNTRPVSVQLIGSELTISEITTLNTALQTLNNKIIL